MNENANILNMNNSKEICGRSMIPPFYRGLAARQRTQILIKLIIIVSESLMEL